MNLSIQGVTIYFTAITLFVNQLNNKVHVIGTFDINETTVVDKREKPLSSI